MDVVSGADRHLDITFGLQVVESSSLVSVIFRETLNHPYISIFHLMDLNAWLQCFAIDVGVMSTKHPEAVSELMSYIVVIIWASEDYARLACVHYDMASYDTAYQQQAAANKIRTGSVITFSLFLLFQG